MSAPKQKGVSEALLLENLRIYNQRELLRIGMRDLYLKVPLAEVARELTSLADALLLSTYALLSRDPAFTPLKQKQCIIALGKLGGEELNYSSDIDIVFVTDNGLSPEESTQLEKLDRKFLKVVGTSTTQGKLFRVDTNLRPYGSQGSLTGNSDYYKHYYQSKAHGWELQSWLKARPVAGNLQLGKKLIREIHQILTAKGKTGSLTDSMLEIRLKTLRSLGKHQQDRDVKQGPGGIRTVEFFVQSLQVQQGGNYPEILTGQTARAMERMEQLGLLDPDTRQKLSDAYLFLRQVEHSIQLEGMQQRSLLPEQENELDMLARRCGFEDRLNEPAHAQLMDLYRKHTGYLKEVSENLFPGSTRLFT